MTAPIFSDEIFTATDLNRRAGHVLDEAKRRPVTITRNEEAFALLLRKDASHMVEAACNAGRMANLAIAISTYRQLGKEVPPEHALEWLNAFDTDDLMGLMAEVYGVFRSALDSEVPWDNFDAVLHEWHESAIAGRSENLAAAFAAPAEEVPLTQPGVQGECGTDA